MSKRLFSSTSFPSKLNINSTPSKIVFDENKFAIFKFPNLVSELITHSEYLYIDQIKKANLDYGKISDYRKDSFKILMSLEPGDYLIYSGFFMEQSKTMVPLYNFDSFSDSCLNLTYGSFGYKKSVISFIKIKNSLEVKNNNNKLDYNKAKAGIYMISNKINGKFYIGKSNDLTKRFYAYLNINRLENNKNIRINRALLKYGYHNFSRTTLEFIDLKRKEPAKKLSQRREYRDLMRKFFGLKSHNRLTLREDFYIKVFKPQYNMKRTSFNVDREISRTNREKNITIPFKVKHLIENCLNPKINS